MRVDTGANGAGGAAGSSIGQKFQQAMQAESGRTGGGLSSGPAAAAAAPADMTQALDGIMKQLQELIGQLGKLIKAMSNGKSSGGSIISSEGQVRSVGSESSGLGGSQGPSERIPDPTENTRDVQLGGKTMTIGSDGSASAAEVDAAAGELQRMYDASPTFKESIDSAGTDNLTVTLGRRGDNTSWGGGGRVFLNLNNIEAGNNDRFQGIVGHEFAHAANGLPHGAELDAIEDRVRAEA